MPLKTEYYFIVSRFRCLICKTYLMVKISENRSKNKLVCENAVHELLTPGYYLLIASVPSGEGGGVPTQGRVQGIPEIMVPYVFLLMMLWLL